MEQEKNKNGVIILLAVLVVILTVLCVLFATGTISFKSNETNNNTSDNNQVTDNSNNQVTDNSNNQEVNQNNIALASLYGTYKYDYEYTNSYGNKVHLKLELTLNSDGTAIYSESDGYAADKTRGTYTYENNKITYTRQYHVASNVDSANSTDTEYTDGNPTEIFTVVDENTLQNTYRDQNTSLKK